MKHIVAIGGGEIGRPGYPIETTAIDKHIISLSGKLNPKVLFLPTASSDNSDYSETFHQYYGELLGCNVNVLNLYSNPSKQAIKRAIDEADIIYVGGGNTLKMMTLWRRMGIDELLIKAHSNGTVLCGLSAGAICWFRGGLSDSRSFSSGGKVWDYINVRGLGLEDFIICPHYDAEPQRLPALRRLLKGSRNVAIALENCTAIEIRDDKFRVILSNPNAKAYKAYWTADTYNIDELEVSNNYLPIESLRR